MKQMLMHITIITIIEIIMAIIITIEEISLIITVMRTGLGATLGAVTVGLLVAVEILTTTNNTMLRVAIRHVEVNSTRLRMPTIMLHLRQYNSPQPMLETRLRAGVRLWGVYLVGPTDLVIILPRRVVVILFLVVMPEIWALLGLDFRQDPLVGK
jgi:hypothetical protein